MKIIEVSNQARSGLFSDEMIARSLSHAQFGDDYVNDQTFISIKIELENEADYRAFLFRRLWECVYLKAAQYSYILDIETNTAIIKISLSEAIRLIQSLTPPALKSKLQEFTKSVDHITTVLNDFLFDPKAQEYYRSVFIKMTSLCEFPYTSNYDKKRTEHLMSVNSSSEVCDVIASEVSIQNLVNIDENDQANLCMSTMVTFAITTKDIKSLCEVLHIGYNVTSVECNAYGTTVRCVTTNFHTFSSEYRSMINSGGEASYIDNDVIKLIQSQNQNNDYILNTIRNTYKSILGG